MKYYWKSDKLWTEGFNDPYDVHEKTVAINDEEWENRFTEWTPEQWEYLPKRQVQIHQNLNLSRIAMLSLDKVRYLRQLTIIGWIIVALLFLIFISGAS